MVGENFRFGRGAAGDPGLLAELGFDVRTVPVVAGVSSTAIRSLLREGDVAGAARLLGRPAEVEGAVVARGPARRNARVSDGEPRRRSRDPRPCLWHLRGRRRLATAPRSRSASTRTTAVTSGGSSRILLDFEGDLYGQRLVVELWRRLRDERAFGSEEELVGQITRDVAETRAAERPA